jgi:predicted nuclease with TOPRIM domain
MNLRQAVIDNAPERIKTLEMENQELQDKFSRNADEIRQLKALLNVAQTGVCA